MTDFSFKRRVMIESGLKEDIESLELADMTLIGSDRE